MAFTLSSPLISFKMLSNHEGVTITTWLFESKSSLWKPRQIRINIFVFTTNGFFPLGEQWDVVCCWRKVKRKDALGQLISLKVVVDLISCCKRVPKSDVCNASFAVQFKVARGSIYEVPKIIIRAKRQGFFF